jgi:hypothetical protein
MYKRAADLTFDERIEFIDAFHRTPFTAISGAAKDCDWSTPWMYNPDYLLLGENIQQSARLYALGLICTI